MKILWLNESLVLRAETREENKALSTVYSALQPDAEENDDNGKSELESPIPNPVG